MRRHLLSFAVAAALSATPVLSGSARAEDAPAASDTAASTSSSTSSTAASTSSGDSGGFHGTGGLFDAADQHRSQMLSLMAIAPTWYYGVGVGATLRYTLPIVPNGFIPKLNDSFELEFGGDVWYVPTYLYDSLLGVAGNVGARYTFHFTDKFDAYLRVALGVQYRHWSSTYNGWSGVDYFYDAGPGVEYRIVDMLVLRGELSYSGLRVGVALAF